jgi:hypothetical protein
MAQVIELVLRPRLWGPERWDGRKYKMRLKRSVYVKIAGRNSQIAVFELVATLNALAEKWK